MPSVMGLCTCDVCSWQVVDTFGEPMKAFGEMTRRGRRRYVRYVV